jgi:hypothetical protein
MQKFISQTKSGFLENLERNFSFQQNTVLARKIPIPFLQLYRGYHDANETSRRELGHIVQFKRKFGIPKLASR